MKGMNQPTPVSPALLQAYIQAGELQFNIKAFESHLQEVNQRINSLKVEHEILNKAKAQQSVEPSPAVTEATDASPGPA